MSTYYGACNGEHYQFQDKQDVAVAMFDWRWITNADWFVYRVGSDMMVTCIGKSHTLSWDDARESITDWRMSPKPLYTP